MTPTATAEIERKAREAIDARPDDSWGKRREDGAWRTDFDEAENTVGSDWLAKKHAYIAAVSPDVVLGILAEHRAALERAERAELHVLELVRGISHSDAALRAAEAERDKALAWAKEQHACADSYAERVTIAEVERDALRNLLNDILYTDARYHAAIDDGDGARMAHAHAARCEAFSRAALQSTSAKEGG